MPRAKPSLAGVFNDLRADFRAGKDTRFVSRLAGVQPMGSGADYHYRVENQWLHMLERSRHYQRNDQVVGQGIRRVVANIVQDGFRLDVDTGDEGVDAELKAGWDEWATCPDQCHSEGELGFAAMEALALSSVITDGDVFALPLKSGSVQFVEAHRCRTPLSTRRNVIHGVLMDDAAKRLEYWFTREDLDPWRSIGRVSDISRYPARDADGIRQVLHLYMPFRFSQRRGVPFIAPASDTVGMHDDTQFATLVKSQMAALICVLHSRGPNWEPGGDQQKGERITDTVGGYTRTIEGVSAGLEIFSDKDEKLDGFSPQIPSPEFFPHTMLLLTFIAINLDIPVHILLLDPSRTNFSGWRGAIDQARLRFRQIQAWMVANFHTPVYRWWLRRRLLIDPALAKAAQRSDVRIGSHRWNPPQFPYIEPLTDATADDLQATRCLNSRRRLQAARGRDWDDIQAEIIADNSSLIRAALREAAAINGEFNSDVNWREVISVPMPDKVSSSLPLDQQAGAAQTQPGQQTGFGGRLGLALNGGHG
jgi:lambda family phage portal protein